MSYEDWKAFSLAELLLSLGEDLEREGLQETPRRITSAWHEFLEGYTLDPKKILDQTFEAEGDGLQLCRNIEFTSMCEHHLLPFFGVCHIAYQPRDVVVGLSKLSRLVDCYGHRLQIQERMVTQIAETLDECLDPIGTLVIVEARHLCCHGRGIRRTKMDFVTSSCIGNVDKEMYQLLQGASKS
jgi:GTP cyclohydrolase I